MWHASGIVTGALRAQEAETSGAAVAGPPAGMARPRALHEPPPARDLRHLLGWFIRVRWMFVAGLIAAVAAGATLFHLDLEVGKTLAIAVVIAAYNLLFAAYHRLQRRRPTPAAAGGLHEAALQIGLDLVSLTVLVHHMGGGTSPLVCLYLIHANAAVMLLPRRAAWAVGAGTFALFLTLVVSDWGTTPPGYALTGVSAVAGQQDVFRVVLALTFLVTLWASMWIVSMIMRSLRLRELQLEEAYTSLTDSQRQLVATEKHASLGRLVAGIAHEINNPIQFIHGNMTLLAEAVGDALPVLDAEAERRPDLRLARLDYFYFRKQIPVLLQDMADGAERIGTIVRELKSFARNDEGRLDEEVDLGAIVRASLRLLHNRLKHFRVEEALDPSLPPLRGNVAQLQQVVVNALQNAAQAVASDGTGRIAVRARAVPGQPWVALEIADNGCGIAPEIRDRIFDPFFTTRQSAGGTGLGLAITEGIVQQHRGRIEVDSQVGRGTTFRFLLPVTERGEA